MAGVVGTRKPLGSGGDWFKYTITAGDGNDTTITHNLGRIPEVFITPKGAAGAAAFMVSKSATTVVVNVSNGEEADVYLWLTGA